LSPLTANLIGVVINFHTVSALMERRVGAGAAA